MKQHLLKCALCEGPLSVWGNDERQLFISCEKCEIATPMEEVISRSKEITFGNHLRAQITQEKKLPASGRDRKPAKS